MPHAWKVKSPPHIHCTCMQLLRAVGCVGVEHQSILEHSFPMTLQPKVNDTVNDVIVYPTCVYMCMYIHCYQAALHHRSQMFSAKKADNLCHTTICCILRYTICVFNFYGMFLQRKIYHCTVEIFS